MSSKTLRQTYRVAKSIVAQLRGRRRFNGSRLVAENRHKVVSAQKLWVLTIISFRADFELSHTQSNAEELVRLLNKVDVHLFLRMLGDMDEALLLGKDPFSISVESTTVEQHEICLAVKQCLNKLLKFFYRNWLVYNDTDYFVPLHQIFAMLSRLSLDLPELRQTAYNAWWKTECVEVVVPEKESNELNSIIRKWFPPLTEQELFEDFMPSHGTGQVTEKVTCLAEKYEHTSLDAGLKLFLRRIGYPLTGNSTPFKQQISEHAECILPCEVIFVNKSWKTFRTISMERTAAMLVQQGIGRCLDHWLKSHRTPFSHHYCINSESWNRKLAFIGSAHGCYDTIDLSAASDSVSWKLVKKVFRNTSLNYAVRCTRTKYVRHKASEGQETFDVTEQTKFAPMGSRMCFPVETIVFGACCALACERSGLPPLIAGFPSFVVYGDDIVIRHEALAALLDILSKCGFTVNTLKSFTDYSPKFCFRESCGAEYLNGNDVCPIRLSRNGFKGLITECYYDPLRSKLRQIELAETVAGLMQLANRCKYRLPLVRKYILDNLIEMEYPICFDETGDSGIISDNPKYVGTQYQRRYNVPLQRYEVKVLCLCPKPVSIRDTEEIIYKPERTFTIDGVEYQYTDEKYNELLCEYQNRVLHSYLSRDLQQQMLFHSLTLLEKRLDESPALPQLFGQDVALTTVSRWIEDPSPILMLPLSAGFHPND